MNIVKTSLIALFLLQAMACQRKQLSVLDLVICKDITDEMNHITYGEVREIMEFNNYLWYGYGIRLRELTDVNVGFSAEAHLPKGNPDLQTELQRKKSVRQFLQKSEQIMTPRYETIAEKGASVLYYGIAQELNFLATESTATNRICIISSNLLENNAYYSVFQHRDRQLLFNYPDSVIRIFQSQLKLENLHGVHVYIVHHASPEDNLLFSEMSKLYTYMLGLKGARVTVCGNLTTPKTKKP